MGFWGFGVLGFWGEILYIVQCIGSKLGTIVHMDSRYLHTQKWGLLDFCDICYNTM